VLYPGGLPVSPDRSDNGDLTYAPVTVQQGPTRAIAGRSRLLPAVPVSGALAAATGGFVAGIVALVTLRAARNRRQVRRVRKGRGQEIRKRSVVATRSFLVDVHLLGRYR
jgi:hypothetical protein